MKKTDFPGTPFATTMARPGNETERRVRRIVRFPKIKRPPTLFLVLAAMAALLCGNLAACRSAEVPSEPSNGGQLLDGPVTVSPKNTPEGDRDSWQPVVSVPLSLSDGRTVTAELYGAADRPEHPDYYRIEEVQIRADTDLLQTIRADELSYDGEYLFEGLFYNAGDYQIGWPDHRDINFDGSEDLGLLAVETYPHNIPYCYLLWDESADKFSTEPLALFNLVTLDGENRQVIEYEKKGPDACINYYRFDSRGKLELLKSEPIPPVPLARQAFRTELEQLYSERVYPGGALAAGPDEDITKLEFSVYDVDGDGWEELVIWYTETYVAARRLFVYGYDPASGLLFEKLEVFPAAAFYSNGVVLVETSHNQGKAGRFWPYFVYRYDAGTDRYEMVGFANALDREVLVAAELDLSSFPSEVDQDGDGLVYYLTEEAYGEAGPVDGAEYEAWRNGWLSGASLLELPRQSLTPENIRAVLPD